jgi:PAS domain-containing protein
MQFGQPHFIARIDYAPRALAFGYAFLVVSALLAERGALTGPMLVCGIAQFLLYPHLAYLHTRIAANSKRAELRNLLADALMLGAWAAQTHFALWISCGLLIGPCISNAANGGVRGLGAAIALFAAGAITWGAFLGFQFQPDTGPYVSVLCIGGIIGYSSWIGILSHAQNRRVMRARDALAKSEEQFRFIAEHAGDLVVVLAPLELIRYASPSHARYFKPDAYRPGQPWFDLVHPEDRGHARHLLDRIAFASTRERVHLRMLAASGACPVMECQGNAVWDDAQNVQMTVLILQDVDARVRTDIERQLVSRPPELMP